MVIQYLREERARRFTLEPKLITLPRRGVAQLRVVLPEVTLDAFDVIVRDVDPATRALHDCSRGHHTPRNSRQAIVDDIGDQQLVGSEVILLVAVVPDVGVPVLLVLVRFVGGVRPLANSILCGSAVPLTITTG